MNLGKRTLILALIALAAIIAALFSAKHDGEAEPEEEIIEADPEQEEEEQEEEPAKVFKMPADDEPAGGNTVISGSDE